MAAPGKGTWRGLAWAPCVALFALLSACSSAGPGGESAADKPAGGCYQSHWQAETVPVINKRLGPDGLEKYDDEHQRQAPGCP